LLWWKAFGAKTLDIVTKATLADSSSGGSLSNALSSHITIQNPTVQVKSSSGRDRKTAPVPSPASPIPKSTPPTVSPALSHGLGSTKPAELERRGRMLKLTTTDGDSPSDSPAPPRVGAPLTASDTTGRDKSPGRKSSPSPGAAYMKKNLMEGERKQIVEELCTHAFEGNAETVIDILTYQPQLLNNQNARGQTALYCASHAGHTNIVLWLLNQKYIDVNIQNVSHGGTALHAASFNAHAEIVALLLKREANREVLNKKGLTPKQEAKGAILDVYGFYEDDQKKLASIFPIVNQLKKA